MTLLGCSSILPRMFRFLCGLLALTVLLSQAVGMHYHAHDEHPVSAAEHTHTWHAVQTIHEDNEHHLQSAEFEHAGGGIPSKLSKQLPIFLMVALLFFCVTGKSAPPTIAYRVWKPQLRRHLRPQLRAPPL